MLNKKSFKIILWGTILTIFLSGCSSSSYTDRYKKEEKKTPTEKKSVRFSSEDDVPAKGAEQTNVYADVPDEVDDLPVEESPVDLTEIVEKYHHLKGLGDVLTSREKMLFEIVNYIDTPYKYGGNGKNGIDCSAFTQNVFSKSIDLQLPRTASEQFTIGNEISNKNNLKFGDLVFFNTTRRSYPGHVGIYLGDNLFAHSSRSKGVTITSLDDTYYGTRFIEGRRLQNFE